MSDQPTLFDAPPRPKRKRHPLTDTTRDAGAAVPEDKRVAQRRQITNALAAYGTLTYHDIAARTGIELQTVCWRMKELRESATVQFVRKADNTIAKQGNRRLVQLSHTTRAA